MFVYVFSGIAGGGGTLRVEIKLRIYLILLIIGVVRLAAYFYWECPCGQKFIKN